MDWNGGQTLGYSEDGQGKRDGLIGKKKEGCCYNTKEKFLNRLQKSIFFQRGRLRGLAKDEQNTNRSKKR